MHHLFGGATCSDGCANRWLVKHTSLDFPSGHIMNRVGSNPPAKLAPRIPLVTCTTFGAGIAGFLATLLATQSDLCFLAGLAGLVYGLIVGCASKPVWSDTLPFAIVSSAFVSPILAIALLFVLVLLTGIGP